MCATVCDRWGVVERGVERVRSNGWWDVDLDVAIVVADVDFGKRRERAGKFVEEHLSGQRERGAVARAVETAVGLVVLEKTALVGADT